MKPKIFSFCNRCSTEWHEIETLSENGRYLWTNYCSDHSIIKSFGMGLFPPTRENGVYKMFFPEGCEMVWIEDPNNGGQEFNDALKKYFEMRIKDKD